MEEHSQLFDICIVCDFAEEANAVVDEFSNRCENTQFQQGFSKKYGYAYRHAVLKNSKGEPLTVLIISLPFTGPMELTLSVRSLLEEFHPRFVAMTGRCAGYNARVKFGDLVIASAAYQYEEERSVSEPDGQLQRRLETKMAGPTAQIIQYANGFDRWKEPVQEILKHSPSLTQEPIQHIAPMASSTAIHRDNPFPRLRKKYHEGTVALDRQTASFYIALRSFPHIHSLVVKGVCDYADSTKHEPYHDYADRASAAYLLTFIQEYVTEQTMPRQDAPPFQSQTSPSDVWNVRSVHDHPSIDICVVCALAEEAQAFLHQVENHCHTPWYDKVNLRYGYDYRLTVIPNMEQEPLQLHVSWLPRYGPQEMVLHLTHVLEEYQPRFVIMTGICAGDKQRVHLGDLIVAERTFTADSGKLVIGEQGQTMRQHDTITYLLNEQILRFVPLFEHWKDLVVTLLRPRSKRHQRDWILQRLLREATASITALPLDELAQQAPDWRQIVHEFQQGADPVLLPSLALRDKAMIERLQYGLDPFPFLDPPEARCHIRPLASSSAVRSDNPFKEIQVPVRGAIAVDMEGAAFGRVMQHFPGIPWLIVKGVSDYADQDKDDSYHTYAAAASAAYALCFIEHYVTQERLPISPRTQHASRDGPSGAWNVPHLRNLHFTGRDELPNRLHQQLTPEVQNDSATTRQAALIQPQPSRGSAALARRRSLSSMPTARVSKGTTAIRSGLMQPTKRQLWQVL